MIRIDVSKILSGAGGPLHLQFTTHITAGDCITLFGPSGAGKTSVLRMLAGLITPDRGTIHVDDECWYDSQHKINRTTQTRDIAMVFQEYALFPNMTVRENLVFALRPGQPEESVDDMLDVIALGELADAKPSRLSGGQRQRIALARALLRKPKLLLLDEPFSAVDYAMQAKLLEYIRLEQSAYQPTIILVSHDMTAVVGLSSRVIVFENGVIREDGKPADVLPLAALQAQLGRHR